LPVVEESVVINKPRQEVFDFMTVTGNVPLWASNVVEFERLSGEEQTVGGVAKGAVKVAGRRLDFTQTILEVEPGSRMKSESTDAKIPFRMELRFADDGAGTKVTLWQDTDSFGGFFGKLGEPVVVKLYSRDVRGNLENAKTLLES
jgi:uncharacterized membrane protein